MSLFPNMQSSFEINKSNNMENAIEHWFSMSEWSHILVESYMRKSTLDEVRHIPKSKIGTLEPNLLIKQTDREH